MDLCNQLRRIKRNPYVILGWITRRFFTKLLPDDIYLKIIYRSHMEEKLDLKNPKKFNEKLQWLKLNDRNPLYVDLVDKYEVRKYIKEKIGEEYLIPLIAKYNCFDEIEFEKLPNKFVLKCTHDSGGVLICKDKNLFNKDKAKEIINNSLNKNYYYQWREWPYKNIKPRIICEKYIEDKNTNDLEDYKFMCFNGSVKCILVCSDRQSKDGVKMGFYDTEWNSMNVGRKNKRMYLDAKKPNKLCKMIELAEKLAQNTKFLRVDFYEIENKIYFGEITFYPAAGLEEFNPKKYDEILGSWIILPKIKRNSK